MKGNYILKIVLLSFLTACISCNVKDKIAIQKNRTFTIQMKGKNYDSLFIYSLSKGPYDNLKIAAEKQDSNHWVFTIPDTVYERLIDFEIVPRTFDYKTNTSNRIAIKSTVNAWRTFLKKEHLPWRSLLSVNVEEVRRKFMVPGIPHAILVFPNKEYVALNLWEKTDREKLYNLINNFHHV